LSHDNHIADRIHSDRFDGATGVEPQAVGASERDRLAA
jgi:hypothetical protein